MDWMVGIMGTHNITMTWMSTQKEREKPCIYKKTRMEIDPQKVQGMSKQM
jgi:hypothetical protein